MNAALAPARRSTTFLLSALFLQRLSTTFLAALSVANGKWHAPSDRGQEFTLSRVQEGVGRKEGAAAHFFSANMVDGPPAIKPAPCSQVPTASVTQPSSVLADVLRGKLLLLVFTILATFLLAGCSQFSPVPRYSYTDADFPLQLLWETSLDKVVVHRPRVGEGVIVFLAGDMSFFSNREYLVAIDQVSGEKLWIQDNINMSSYPPLLIYQDAVILGNLDGSVSVFDLHSGKLRWSEIVGENSSSRVNDLAVAGNTVYSITDPTQIESRNLETGKLQWRVGFDKVLHSGIPMRGPRLHFAHDRLYLLLGNPVVILDASTGEVLERLNISRRKGSAHGDRMYLPEFAYDFPDMEITATYGVTNPDYSQEMCGEFDPSFAHFRFDGDFIFATGACGGVYKLDKDGIVLWEYEPSLVANPPMALLDDILYVFFKTGEIHAIEKSSGEYRGSLVLNRPLPGMLWRGDYSAFGVNTAGDAIIVTLNNQQVWAFSEKR